MPREPLQPLLRSLRVHPRVAYQGLYARDEARRDVLASLPPLIPFRRAYAGALAIVDWDHRLPSKSVALRIYAYYDDASFAAGEAAFDDRLEDIGVRDRFPEFDVPDFADLPADEAYEAELDDQGRVSACRLTSTWRREVDETSSQAAVKLARLSEDFKKLERTERGRHLGDLEAVSWTPPCESGHPRWTLDVWYLMAFDGRIGTGRSFLVDLDDRRVVAVRDFSVRAG